MSLFTEAEKVVNGDRRQSYGDARLSFNNIANVWSGILGAKLNVNISPEEVALMMIGLKLCREANSHKDDNIVDIYGYTLCLENIQPLNVEEDPLEEAPLQEETARLLDEWRLRWNIPRTYGYVTS